MDTEVFVLLDDCQASEAAPSSRLYSAFVREHLCTEPHTLDALWKSVTADQRSGLHAAVLIDYEWGAKLQHAGLRPSDAKDRSALRVLMFKTLEHLPADAVSHWLAQRDASDAPSPAGICDLQPSVDQSRFEQDIARIQTWISQGETYQVNYTFNLRGSQYGTPIGLYRRLRAMQPVAFGALACLPRIAANTDTASTGPHGTCESTGAGLASWVLSSSPELFVRNQSGHLTTRPMKGTATRLPDPAADRQRAAWLAADAKNRAENVMIVDLLRNDLGRISQTGSVTVPRLFAVETYQTVHQMTSTVESRMRAGVDFPAVLRALFPCGSITGAPKLHSMDLIATLESGPRGLYCGAIGWVDAPDNTSPAGDFCLSVAIRTLVLGAAQGGRRPATLGVGGGIVLDSNASDEFAETRAKTRYLTTMDPGFTLFETMRATQGHIQHLPLHLQRLHTSAQALGFAFDREAVHTALSQRAATLDARLSHRIRLDLRHDGSMHLQHSALMPLPDGPARLLLADAPVPAAQAALLNHKTSLRGRYDAAIQQALSQAAFDVIFQNVQGEVTEGARSSLLVQRAGKWYTPALASGVLAGVMRQRLLRRYPSIIEKALALDEVLSAQTLLVCSALRGVQRAEWLRDATGAVLRVGQVLR